MPEDVSAFFERLEKAKARPLSVSWRKLITLSDRNKIIDYCLNQKEAIAALRPGEARRFDKKKKGLPRTVNILCAHDGKLKLMVEFKSKVADGTKLKKPRVGGTFKTGKMAGQLDAEKEVEYFNLVSIIQSEDDRFFLKKEVELTQAMKSGKIDLLELGKEFTKTDKDGVSITKRSVYSIKANSDLFGMLRKNQYMLSQSQKNIMILDLLEGLKVIHDKGFVHQDIKSDNILVYGDSKKGYRLKIADLGLAMKEGALTIDSVSSAGYQSPEMACYYAKPETFHHEFFQKEKSQASLGHRYSCMKEASAFQVLEGGKPSKANDMWSLGLVCCGILYGKQPVKIEEMKNIDNVLIKGLLNPYRSARFTVDKAIVVTLVNILLQPHHTDKELKRVADLLNNNEAVFNEVNRELQGKMGA